MKKSISTLTLGLILTTLVGVSGSNAFGNNDEAEPTRDEKIYGKWNTPNYGSGRWKNSQTFEFSKEGATVSTHCWAEEVEKFGPKIDVAYFADGKKLGFLNPNAVEARETKEGRTCIAKLPAKATFEYELQQDLVDQSEILTITVSPEKKLHLRR